MAENLSVTVDDKKFIGIGKFLFDTYHVEWNIPHLHFMVDESEYGHFEATNLEFGLVSSGETQMEAIQHLAALTHSHVTSVMTGPRGYEEFIETAKSRAMDEYWTAYRIIDFTLAEQGRDLSHELERKITRAIQEMLDEKVKELITQRALKKADELLKAFEQVNTFKLKDVEYTELRTAA
jgi:hypothetical protein